MTTGCYLQGGVSASMVWCVVFYTSCYKLVIGQKKLVAECSFFFFTSWFDCFSMCVYSCEIVTDTDCPEWMAFVSGLPHCDIRQQPVWAKAKKAYGDDARLLMVRHQGIVVGGALVLVRRYALGLKVGIVSQGPCLSGDAPNLVRYLASALKLFCHQSGLLYLIVELPYFKTGWLNLFQENGFVIKPAELPGGLFYHTTSMLDLSYELDQVLSFFSASRRRYVCKSTQLPVSFREGELDDLDACFDLFLHTANKRNGFFVEPSKSFFRELLGVPKPHRQVLLLIGEVEGQMVSASFCLLSGEVFMHYIWGWTGEYADQHYSDAVYWHLIQLAKGKGFRYFDFVQVDNTVASAISSGKPIDSSLRRRSFFGPTYYKMSFGGQLVHSPGILCCYPSTFHHWMFQCFFAKLVINPLFRYIIKLSGKFVKSLL